MSFSPPLRRTCSYHFGKLSFFVYMMPFSFAPSFFPRSFAGGAAAFGTEAARQLVRDVLDAYLCRDCLGGSGVFAGRTELSL